MFGVVIGCVKKEWSEKGESERERERGGLLCCENYFLFWRLFFPFFLF